MSFPHSYHCVTFFNDSALFRPLRHVKLNCLTFHYYLRLTPSDADLFWATGRCFVCGGFGHRSENCRSAFGSVRYVCNLLGDPHGEYSSLISPLILSDVRILLAYDDCRPKAIDNALKVDEDPWKGASWSGNSWGDSPPSLLGSLFDDSESSFNGFVCMFSDRFILRSWHAGASRS